MKGKWSFVIFAAVMLGALLVYTFTAKEYPRIPSDNYHKDIKEAACMECHGPGKKYEMKRTHPPKFECLKCHKPAESS